MLDKRRLIEEARQLEHLQQWQNPFCIAEEMRQKDGGREGGGLLSHMTGTTGEPSSCSKVSSEIQDQNEENFRR